MSIMLDVKDYRDFFSRGSYATISVYAEGEQRVQKAISLIFQELDRLKISLGKSNKMFVDIITSEQYPLEQEEVDFIFNTLFEKPKNDYTFSPNTTVNSTVNHIKIILIFNI
jgi:hypothetical protein